MKILVMTDYNAPYGGNFIESLKSLDIELTKNGDSLYYLVNDRAQDKPWIPKIEAISNKKVKFYNKEKYLNIYIRINECVKSEKIDAIYCHFCRPKTQIAIKLYTIFKRRVKLISHFHNHCKASRNPLKELFYRFAYFFYKGDLNIGCSESVMKSMPYRKEKCTYVDNAINFERLNYYNDINIKKNENEYVVLMFGFDYYRKGIDIALKAVKNMKNVRLAISLASNRSEIEKIIMQEEGEIPDYITFLKPINDVASYYKMADVFVSAAREEGFCYSIVEAAYCGTKIITSDIPGVPKEIPGELIFKKEDSEDLQKCIQKSITMDINVKAKEYVENKYGIDSWSSKIMKCIQKLFIL